MRKAPCWFDSDDQPFSTLQQCQVSDLSKLLAEFTPQEIRIAEALVKNSAAVMNILNVTDKSRLGARKLNGAKRKKRYEAEQKTLPLAGTGPMPPELSDTKKPF